ncbi:hypothetical protein LSTR_LSTR010728 [Laodelphax striatellus]|uniref:Uncharacterized protein n=1 Tax=Laodelphax striatellus TaxID=195883 RepID=A0A482X675_LAOST|nr:hypothetical protein LSTR_LSTR016456 [Laodelphax striatellus]RZF49020.1 hypothetical protein LSTR_LSTR010728 [Laodelphax striatellus]
MSACWQRFPLLQFIPSLWWIPFFHLLKWGDAPNFADSSFKLCRLHLAVFLVWFTQRYRAGYASKRAPTRTLSHRNGVETEDSDVWLTLYYCLFNVLAVTPTYAMMERIS